MSAITETRRILLDGTVLEVRREGAELVAQDGRRIAAERAVHLAPSEPSKIVCVHLNYRNRLEELKATCPPAPPEEARLVRSSSRRLAISFF